MTAARPQVEGLRLEAGRARDDVEAALREVATIRRQAAAGGLYACVPLGEVLADPWLVRRVCGPLPLGHRPCTTPGCRFGF